MLFSDICIILNAIKYMDLKKKNEPLNFININIQSLNLKIATAYAYSYISKSVFIMQILTFPYLTKKIFLKISSTHWKTLNIIVWIFWITSASYRQLPIVFYVDVNWIITWDQHKCFDLITQTLYTHFKNCSIVLFKYLLISTGKSV